MITNFGMINNVTGNVVYFRNTFVVVTSDPHLVLLLAEEHHEITPIYFLIIH